LAADIGSAAAPALLGISRGSPKANARVRAIFHRDPVEDIKSVKLDLMIEFARMERIEIGDAINAEKDGLAIDDELLVSIFQRRLDDPGIALRPVVAAARDQPHTFAISLDAKAVAIIFDLVDPLGRSGTLMPRVGRQKSKVPNMRST
jgi:hypothetical protein